LHRRKPQVERHSEQVLKQIALGSGRFKFLRRLALGLEFDREPALSEPDRKAGNRLAMGCVKAVSHTQDGGKQADAASVRRGQRGKGGVAV